MYILYKGVGQLQVGDVKSLRMPVESAGRKSKWAVELIYPLTLLGGEIVYVPDSEELHTSITSGVLSRLLGRQLIATGDRLEDLEGEPTKTEKISRKASPESSGLEDKVDALTDAVAKIVDVVSKLAKGKKKRKNNASKHPRTEPGQPS